MNSLNIISSRVSPQNSPTPSRTNSCRSLAQLQRSFDNTENQSTHDDTAGLDQSATPTPGEIPLEDPETISKLAHGSNPLMEHDNVHKSSEKTPLLAGQSKPSPNGNGMASISQRIYSTIIATARCVLYVLAWPFTFVIGLFYDDDGNFRWMLPPRKLLATLGLLRVSKSSKPKTHDKEKPKSGHTKGKRRGTTSAGSKRNSTIGASDSDSYSPKKSSRGSRDLSDASTPTRSIRIKVQTSDEALKERRHRKTSSVARVRGEGMASDSISAQIKSPTSPASAITKYPRAPAPPRPLIPRRQPSYLNFEGTPSDHQKTLILDLDETLIHSMSKGNRLGTGHMVEVRLNTAFVGQGGQTALGPQHPILYYVHKRPYCDDFLRRVSKWYKLVVFTASVQEYADPVIDWLETDRKYFAARYYRQHCTYRQGAFIKDLSTVEPDLSKVVILDNSPLSYMFHPDNAIPISGWISDPTDYDLLHLVPLLEGLQYVSDVRALLALRGGEDGQHST